MLALRCALVILSVLTLGGCGTPTEIPGGPAAREQWHPVLLPGKRATAYRNEYKDGRIAVAASANASASMWRRHVARSSGAIGDVEFSWWAQAIPANADVSRAEHDDAAARVMFSFAGDASRLSPRNQMLFELAQTLTGESPPFATLMYVWDANAPAGSVIVHPRSDRIRKIVVESGRSNLRTWRTYRRNLSTDFQLAFGEAPGALQSMALMTDGDNTHSQLVTWYGDITLH